MEYQGIIITGTSGAGRSTVASELCEKHNILEIVQVVSTWKKREDDNARAYKYISKEKFEQLNNDGKLLIKTKNREEYYGITYEAFQRVISNSKIPLLTIIPKSLVEFEKNQHNGQNNNLPFFTIFLDTLDDIIDVRLKQRQQEIDKSAEEQRHEDRRYSDNCLYIIKNTELDKTVELIWNLWGYRKTGGTLSKRLIGLMIDCGMLLENSDPQNIKGASYDLSLGDEYFYGGKIENLSDKEPFILIEPYDYVITASKELANFPRDIAGRFDLSVSLFCQGIILSNGPQVDPGFRGKLFCLLFNTSNTPIFLKRGQHYATIEFNKLIEPTTSYTGKYQDRDTIMHYLPSNTMKGAINELKKELEEVRREGQRLQTFFLGITSLILVIIAILLAIR